MERSTQFDLTQEINSWKSQLLHTESFNKEELDELESHLLDEMDDLSEGKLNHEEKFIIAQHRLGSEKLLAKAYKSTKGFNFQKLSWFGQALVFMSIFMVVSRMAVLLFGNTLYDEHTWFNSNILGAAIIYIGLKAPAAITVYLLYRWTQKKAEITKANNVAILSLVLLCGLHLIQILTFRSESVALNQNLGALLWSTSSYILLFITFIILNVRQVRKSGKLLQVSA